MVPFCALGTDHALEQENKKMEVLGGISGIANKKFTMESYFVAAPMLNRICENLASTFTGFRIDKKQHHQLTGSFSSRCYNDVSKLITVYENHEVDFSNTDDVFNIVTKVVLPPSKAHDSIGEELYIKFKEERLQGDRSVSDPMKKRKMPTFTDTSKSFKTKVDDKIVEIKEEKRLLAKFVIASRKRDDIDLPAYFGRFEFTVVPRSMFRQDGSLLLGTDKATVMHEIEKMIPGNNGDHHHGWKRLIDESLQPITTDLPPAPEPDTKRCACMKAGLVCTEMCFCQNCENVEHESEDENDDSDDDNEIDSDDDYIDSYDSDDD